MTAPPRSLPTAVLFLLRALLVAGAVFSTMSPEARAAELAIERSIGAIEPMFLFEGPMPTGVTVSRTGRIFVTFPRWGDDVPFTVGEIVGLRKVVAYPDAAMNTPDEGHPSETLFTVQSALVDAKDRLWLVETGTTELGPPRPGAAKLVAVDLATNKVVKRIVLRPNVVLPTTYLNDVRIDLRRGAEGFAYVPDSSSRGPGAIIVVDLASGHAWRRLDGHPSTQPDSTFVPVVEGEVLMNRPNASAVPTPFRVAADGIALSADGSRVFYSPLSSRHLFSVSADALVDTELPDERVATTVIDHGEKGASDGLESDAEGRIYVTDYEHDGIRRRSADGTSYETLVHDPRALWPDTLSLAADGYLYFTANQLHRQPGFHGGRDLRQKPYVLFRIKIDGTPVQLP
jgi:sugar lactone lactonase YvrE